MGKLKGSTIIEVLVAMVIILACSSLATVIYLNVLQSQNSAEKLKAFRILKQFQQETESKGNFINEETEADAFTVKKECRPYQGNMQLIQLTFSIRNAEGKELIRQSKLVVSE
jgi:Tfp pilus assembly protein PilV